MARTMVTSRKEKKAAAPKEKKEKAPKAPKVPKEPKAKKPPAEKKPRAPRAAPEHPKYANMIVSGRRLVVGAHVRFACLSDMRRSPECCTSDAAPLQMFALVAPPAATVDNTAAAYHQHPQPQCAMLLH